MAIIAGVNYDPAVAVLKPCTAALVMTALDTTNLRLTFTVPASGRVFVRMGTVLHGGTAAPWMPAILLGIMNTGVIVARKAPMMGGGHLAATTMWKAEAGFLVSNLSPGSTLNWDAAYSVETAVANSNLKYGGPADATANNAFGGFSFEIWEA